MVAESITNGAPPSSVTPTEKETLVLVDGLSKIRATVCGPAKTLELKRSDFSEAARSRISACSSGFRSSSRRKCLTMNSILYFFRTAQNETGYALISALNLLLARATALSLASEASTCVRVLSIALKRSAKVRDFEFSAILLPR